MSMQDPVADMLTRIRNAQREKYTKVSIPYSKYKQKIADILKKEGYISDYEILKIDEVKSNLVLHLKYDENGDAVISVIKRISKPGIRTYLGYKDLSNLVNFISISIISTSKGLMSAKDAIRNKLGGEYIFYIS